MDRLSPAAAGALVALSGGTFLTLALTVSLNAAVWSLAVTAIVIPLGIHNALVLRERNTPVLGLLRNKIAPYLASAAVVSERVRRGAKRSKENG